MSARRGVLALCLLALVVVAGRTAGAEDADPCAGVTLRSTVVPVRYKSVSDAARLVDQLLGPCGEYRVPKALGVVTVEDEPQRLERILEAVASWDVPPQSVEVTVSLILARRDTSAARDGLVGEIRGVTEALSQVTSYTTFERLGTATIVAMEGREASLELGPEYRAKLRLGAVDRRRGIVQLVPFALLRPPRPGEVAAGLPPGPRTLLSAELDLPEGQLHLVGAPGRDRDKAIFLAIRATAIGRPGVVEIEIESDGPPPGGED